MLGKMDYIEIAAPGLEEKLRTRYRKEIDTLAAAGFGWLCGCGEAFSAFRLLLILPAVMVAMMLFKREVIRLRGAKLMLCYPVLVSSDRTTLATPFGLCVKFYSTFTDGTGLVSATRNGEDVAGPPVIKRYYAAGIPEVWARHRQDVRELTAAGRCPDRHTGLQKYIEISVKEDALAGRARGAAAGA